MRLLRDLDVEGKRVFVRADLDVPLEQLTIISSQFTESATRLKNLKPTIDYLLEHGATQIIIAGHIGRPEGMEESKSTKQLLETLEKILGQKIGFCEEFPISNDQFPKESLVLFENLRFWEEEIKNDVDFAKKLAGFADVYINEAFGNSHREHASMAALPKFLSHAAGLHLEEEIKVLGEVLKNPKRPLIAVVGGAKLETKIPVIENLSKHADKVLVGGELLKEFQINENKVVLGKLTMDSFDIDEESINRFIEIINSAKSVVWNGPMGLFEEGHEQGTLKVAEAIINSGCYSIVGGGETTQFLASKNLLTKFSFVSTGGGAMLEFLAGKELPGIKALE